MGVRRRRTLQHIVWCLEEWESAAWGSVEDLEPDSPSKATVGMRFWQISRTGPQWQGGVVISIKGCSSSLPILFMRDLQSYWKVTWRNYMGYVEREGRRLWIKGWGLQEEESFFFSGDRDGGRGSTAAASGATALRLSERNPPYACTCIFASANELHFPTSFLVPEDY